MTTSDDRALALLHGLLEVCRDSAAGYETAIRDLPDLSVRRELGRFRDVRNKIAEEIERRIRDLRGDPATRPSVLSAVHRAWIDTRSAASSNPSESVLAEVERGEDLAVDAFRQVLQEHDIDPVTRALVVRRYEEVQTAHDRVRQLRDREVRRTPEP